jgi:hypothetical protein
MRSGTLVFLLVTFSSTNVFSKGCESFSDAAERYGSDLERSCGFKTAWDLSKYIHFKTDQIKSICRNKQELLSLVKTSLEKICEVPTSAQDLKTVLKNIKIVGTASSKLAIQIQDGSLFISGLEKEGTYNNDDWVNHQNFVISEIRRQTKLKLYLASDIEKLEKEKEEAAELAEEQRKEQVAQEKQKKFESKRDEIGKLMEENSKKYADKLGKIWSTPGTTAESAKVKQAEADKARAEFEAESERLDKAMKSLNVR